jgi:peptidoglycan hydrolase CwlO-like protein
MENQIEKLKKVHQELCEKNEIIFNKIREQETALDFNENKLQDETEELRAFAQDLETQLSILDCVIEALEILNQFNI